MSSLSQAQRDKLPLSAFCWPEERKYPLLDQADLDAIATLIGRAPPAKQPAIKARALARAKELHLTPPKSWQAAKMSVETALAETATPDGEWVLRTGKLFEAGSYDDKDYAMSPEDILAAADGFTPVPVDLEHVPTLLDGKLGEVRSLSASEDGRDLYGTVALPKWLDDALPTRKVSASWDRTTKRLTGLALVRDPRVLDAALMAAFAGSRHSTKDAADIQRIHDLATAQGAACAPTNVDPDDAPGDPAQTPYGLRAKPGVGMSKKGRRMNIKDWLTGKAIEEGIQLDDAASFGTPTPDPRIAELEAKIAARDAQFAADKLVQRTTEATAFADAQIAAFRVLPAGREALVALYVAAAAQEGPVTFANGEQHSLTETLATVFAALPTHSLTQQVALTPDQRVLMAASTPNPNGPMTAERRAELLGQSSLGRAVANGTH